MKLGDWIVRAIESQSAATLVTTTSGPTRSITPADLRRWQLEMGCTHDTAAQALGVSCRMYAYWLVKPASIPAAIDLACAALVERLAPYSAWAHRSDS